MFFLNLPNSLDKVSGVEIVYEPRLCSRGRFPRSRCQLCLQGCPSAALSYDKTLKIDNNRCTNCGICISRCPNGVFWSRKRGDEVIAQDIQRLLDNTGGHSIVFACPRSTQNDNIIILPCIGKLTENLLVAPFIFGASQVEIQWPECSGCACGKCLSHLEQVISFSRQLITLMGKTESNIRVTKVGKQFTLLSAPDRLSRRDLFRRLKVEVRTTGATLLPEFGGIHQNNAWAQFIGAKRSHLLKTLRTFSGQRSTCVPAENIPLANVEINNSCTGCPVCTVLCPTGALGKVEDNKGVDMYFRPDICTGCNICREACLFKAITFTSTIELLNLVTGQVRKLVHLHRKSCSRCGMEFLSTEQEICMTCRHERVDTALSLKGRE